MVEVKFFGTGGHGIVVAAKMLAHAAAGAGYQAQAFASYGAARRGGKVEGYVRISSETVLLHSKVYETDYAVLMDKSLVDDSLKTNLKKSSVVLINTAEPPGAFAALSAFKVVTVDADRIAAERGLQLPSGIRIINTAMLGAIAGLLPGISPDHLDSAINEGGIPQPGKNIEAAREAYRRVQTQPSAPGRADENGRPSAAAQSEQRFACITKTPPCQANCPAGEDIEKTATLVRNGQFIEALENIRTENPFPGVCGRVCFHPCESNCNRGQYDEPVATKALERAAFDHAGATEVRKPAMKEKTGKKVAVIGSGPAGLTCACFLALMGHDVTVFEALPEPGGLLRFGIPDYRLPGEIIRAEISDIVRLGIDIRTGTRVGSDVSFERIRKQYDACFIGIGSHSPLRLKIPGEASAGVLSGLEFLRDVKLGKKINPGNSVAVIGGGNVAIDVARTARRLGAQKVSIVCLESREMMPACREEIEATEKEGIRILCQNQPVQVCTRGNSIEKLACIAVRGGERDSKGWKRWPEKVAASDFAVTADTIIVAIGGTMDSSFLPADAELDHGLIKIDTLGGTTAAGVYAGGDAAMVGGTVVDAVASGKRAALGIDIFLRKKSEGAVPASVVSGEKSIVSMKNYLSQDSRPKDRHVVSFSDLNTAYFQRLPRAPAKETTPAARTSNFDEVCSGLDPREASAEAERCFHCGACNMCENCFILCPDIAIRFDEKLGSFAIDHDLCKQCGICEEECPRAVISPEKAVSG